ncbi:O-antigen ligase family protein [Fervidobacterium thailandense]|uniref:O-antigen ligase-related domain-containing protein n=1 Tax=Fervidobacterium thailandense TaxID=1008305 RepID=A0A1E3G442_9BACT|nr:O-antigen ligase family protein [Fervidobacterium thailandense]ODN30997.1 hypothetical protein A4H02_01610 [Fervidobacterium thailandense]
MTLFEELVWYITIPLVALFSHRKYTYEFSTPKYAILLAGVVLISAILLMRLFKSGKLRFVFTPVHLAWLGFSIAGLLSTFNILRDNPSFFRLSIDIALYTFVNVLLSFYFSTVMRDKKLITRMLYVFMLTGLVVAVNAILNFYTGYDLFLGQIGEPFKRASIKANVGNVIFVSNYLNMLLPIALYFMLTLDLEFFGTLSYKGIAFFKVFSLVSAVLYFTVIIFSQTRSEYIILILEIVLLLLFYLSIRKKNDSHAEYLKSTNAQLLRKLILLRKALIFVFVSLIVVVVVLYNVPSPLNKSGEFSMIDRFNAMASVSAKDERFLSWFSTFYIWKDHKLLGQGIGTYQLYGLYGIAEMIREKPEYMYGWNNFKRAHNDYFQVLSETGIIGFGFILAMLILLSIYVFRNIGLIQDKDDAVLFLMLVLSGVVFAVQSFFSFPAHLLPNALLANFVISTGLGRYFNRTHLREVKIERKVPAVLVGTVLLAVIVLSTYLRWSFFVSEVFFKRGSEAYEYLTTYRSLEEKLRDYLKQLETYRKQLEELSGEFEIFKPDKWHEEMKKRAGILYRYDEYEAKRRSEIEDYRAKLEKQYGTLFSELTAMSSKISESYRRAKDYFLKSVRVYPAYGRALFYLASLATDEIRVEELLASIESHANEILNQNFDELQKVVHRKYRHNLLGFLAPLVGELKNYSDADSRLKKLVQIQAILDSISLYETSLLTFTERNAFKGVATRYMLLYNYVEDLSEVVNGNQELREHFSKVLSAIVDKFCKWVRNTVWLIPGGWNRFPDWKNLDVEEAWNNGKDIYRFFANQTVSTFDTKDPRISKLLFDLASLESKACYYMEQKGVWGVPDGVLPYLYALERKGELDSNFTVRQLRELYEANYRVAQKKLDDELLRKRFSNLLTNATENTAKILEVLEVSEGLRRTFQEDLQSALSEAFGKFTNYDFRKVVSDYFKTLLETDRKDWPYVTIKSIWADIALTSFESFISDITRYAESEDDKELIAQLSKSISNDNSMLMFERYDLFKALYETVFGWEE